MDVTIKRTSTGTLMAVASVAIDTVEFGRVVIKNFQIWKSENYNDRIGAYANITPPSIKTEQRKYFKLAYFDDPIGWEKAERQIWDEYQNYLYDNNDE